MIATFILPLLAKSEEVTTEDERAEIATRIRILRNVIRELKEQTLPETKAATDEVIEDYRKRIYDLQQNNSSNRGMDERERAKRLEIIQWERENTQKMTDEGRIVATDSYRYQHYLNMMEQAIKQRFRTKVKTAWMFLYRLIMLVIHPKKWGRITHKVKKGISKDSERFQAIRQLREDNEILIISKLKEQLTKENVDIIGPLITEHTIFLERVRKEHSPRDVQDEGKELIIQKSTELGAHKFISYKAERSVVKWDDKKVIKKIERLQKIAQEAAEQSHRTIIPEVHYAASFKELMFGHVHYDFVIAAYEESAREGEDSALASLFQTMKPGQSVLCIFGPEGGISEKELLLLEEANAKLAGLGPRILRTETAPLYVLSAASVG